MQTIKTAAIVVLLMTVMYGAYVSLTTPPEPLPDEVHQMLVESNDFDIDAGFPESLDSLGPPPGSEPVREFAGGQPSSNSEAQAAPSLGQATQRSLSGVSGSLSDQNMQLAEDVTRAGDSAVSIPTNSTPATAAGASYDALEGDRLASRDPTALPAVDASAPARSVDPNRDYPSTGGDFALPDPQQAADQIGFEPDDTEQSSRGPNLGLTNALRTADEQYHAGKKKEALATLSLFYDTPKLTAEERSELLRRLDPLAREVIYSQSHLLEQPHRVRQNETLMEIAADYEVPWQLLANINGVQDPITVLPGTDLKIVRGPFRADVSLSQQELTLFVGDYYAGRFPVAIGSDPAPEPGSYTIQDKQTSKTYYDATGNPVPPSSPNNPYGSLWLDLGGRFCIHGSPSKTEPTTKGCISLAGDHAADLLGILSQGSAVVIRP